MNAARDRGASLPAGLVTDHQHHQSEGNQVLQAPAQSDRRCWPLRYASRKAHALVVESAVERTQTTVKINVRSKGFKRCQKSLKRPDKTNESQRRKSQQGLVSSHYAHLIISRPINSETSPTYMYATRCNNKTNRDRQKTPCTATQISRNKTKRQS